MWLLLIAVVVATYFIQAYRITILPPSSSALLLGIFFGILSRLFGLSQTLRFSPAAFFYALLPPIVFAAGFTLKKRAFFENIGAILTYAILGTVASTLAFAFGTYFLVLIGVVRRSHMGGSPFVECLMYGAAISSIDPVATLAVLAQTDTPPVLYNIVFGESVLNDAVAIVLFRSLSSYSKTHAGVGVTTLPAVAFKFCILAAGSLVVGVGVALACAFLLKRFEAYYSRAGGGWYSASHQRQRRQQGSTATVPPPPHALDPTIYEIAIVVMGSYLAYLVAEVAGFSGIVALFFSGIVHAHYSHYNVSPDARIALRRFFEVGAFLCELFVFAYLGLQVATNQHSFDFGLFVSGIPLAVASRAANVFPCTRLINTYRVRKFPKALRTMLWAVGLRGAVAYGLIVNMPRSDTGAPGEVGIPAIETAALFVVVVSTLVLGSATGPLLRHLELEGRSDADVYAAGWAEEGAPGQPEPPPPSVVGGGLGRSAFHERFRQMDEMVLKPLFGGRLVDGNDNDGNDDDNDDNDNAYDDDGKGRNRQGSSVRQPLVVDIEQNQQRGGGGHTPYEYTNNTMGVGGDDMDDDDVPIGTPIPLNHHNQQQHDTSTPTTTRGAIAAPDAITFGEEEFSLQK